MTLEAGTHIGKYVVRRKLAEGGMAEIYLCTARGAEGFEKEVVIKRVRAFLASDPEFVGMFIAEARLASRLNHANVVQIFDFDKHQDTYYLAMEYVRGCSLWELRKRGKELMEPVPPMLVAHMGAEIARGLHYAHRVRVNGQPLDLVHRDVTPHNVLLSFDGAVKLTDFGIAKAGNKLTQPGVLKGKFAYMSPEQARGEAVDARTDIFALGVVLWEMLTGGRLFDGDSEVAVLRAVQQSAIPPPARLNPDVPADLDAAVVRALDRDPALRFQTAAEFERALAQCVLTHATSVDDTDLSAFMRRLFPTSLTQAIPAVQERTDVVAGGQVREAARVPREPTAVMVPSGRNGMALATSPDEDVNAPTFVLPRRGEEAALVSAPLPPMATPMMPLPAVPSSPVPRFAAAERPLAVDGARSGDASEPSAGSASRDDVPAGGAAGSEAGAVKAPSQGEGVSLVEGARTPSQGSGLPAMGARTPSRPEGLSSVPEPSSLGLASAWDDEEDDDELAAASNSAPDAQPSAAKVEARPAASSVTPDAGVPSGASARRPWALGLSVALGLAVIGGGGVWAHSRLSSHPSIVPELSEQQVLRAEPPVPESASNMQAAAPDVAAPAVGVATPPEDTQEGESASPSGADAESEVDGLMREEVLAAAAPSAEVAPTDAEAQPTARAAPAGGTLQIQAAPYATVFINGKRMGEVAGRASYRLPAGVHKLVFEHPTGERRYDVTVTAGGTVSREFRAPKAR
ncbi:Serine/threonine kinase PKN11 [Myxococcus hansupus]|uniref:non-specific serine/threonine protein kinase n=1 Tax=Pseudomyxococcus hansupus TaxID=1297742 RepID=A0A0H4XG36_9BACT|nr:serine/threonine-protein kinase [Myxococcus hansupus]AKQ67187.1 Serine/threonine kinase PKN11 [Myxococcus hansupus]